MNDDLTKQFIELEKSHEEEKIRTILKDKLKHDPDNIDLMFRMAVLNFHTPFVEYTSSGLFIEKIIAVSKKHESIAKIFIKYRDYDFFTIAQAFSWIYKGKDRNLINDSIKSLLDQIIEHGTRNNVSEEAKRFIESELKRDTKNVEFLFLQAIMETGDKAIELFEKIITISKENEAIATVFFAYMVDVGYAMDKELFNRLKRLRADNPEINSMVKYAMSWFYRLEGNQQLEEKYLKESIDFYQRHVWNYVYLARLYHKQGRKSEAEQLIQTARSNLKKTPANTVDLQNYDPTSVNIFLNERVSGIFSDISFIHI